MTPPHTTFLDADAFVAMVKADDPNHARARGLFERLQRLPVRFVTSNYVFSETVTVLSQRVSRQAALAYIDTMQAVDSPVMIAWVDDALDALAIDLFRHQTSKNTSFVDCTNMAFLKRDAMNAIFSFDEVYRTNGFYLVETFLEQVGSSAA